MQKPVCYSAARPSFTPSTDPWTRGSSTLPPLLARVSSTSLWGALPSRLPIVTAAVVTIVEPRYLYITAMWNAKKVLPAVIDSSKVNNHPDKRGLFHPADVLHCRDVKLAGAAAAAAADHHALKTSSSVFFRPRSHRN